MARLRLERVAQFLGIESGSVSHKEKIISGVGAFLGVLFTYFISSLYLDNVGTLCLVSSMGASAVLLFGAPHGTLSQPWPLVGGHLVSAFIGVLCSRSIDNPMLAGPLAVGLSMVLMHYAHCIHPPGGATALTAVIGGSQVQQMGFEYLVTPVLFNVAAILLVAFVFNGFFKWRRYPAALAQRTRHPDLIPRESLHYAMRELNSFIDVSDEDLEEIYTLAAQHAARKKASSLPATPPKAPFRGKNPSPVTARRSP